MPKLLNHIMLLLLITNILSMLNSRSERLNHMTSLLIRSLSLHFFFFFLIVYAAFWYKTMILIMLFWKVIIFQKSQECIVVEAIKYLLVSLHISNSNKISHRKKIYSCITLHKRLCYIKMSTRILESSLRNGFTIP